jgi:lysophospholipase L1-like esterase
LGIGPAGCESSTSEPTGAGGSAGTGVAGGTGGAAGIGGSSATGGTSSGGRVTGAGGVAGGSGASGGSVGIGGAGGVGGITGTGGVAGGSGASGGSAGTGGTGGVGGITGTGGAAGAGGARGGSTGTGGATATGAGGGSGTTGGGGSSSHTGTWRIMPLGDSITGSTCYPQLLSKALISSGHTKFNFIGSNLNNQSCGAGAPSLMTEGHGGYDVTYLVSNSPPQPGHGTLAELQRWAAQKPDVVLMQYGTNDVWGGVSRSSILNAYSFVVDQFRSQNPSAIFFVAQITPLRPSGCAACESNVEDLNAMIPSWAAGKTSTVSPIYVVNVWAALPQASYLPNSQYTSDGVHPNAAGSQLMADAWYAALVAKNIP